MKVLTIIPAYGRDYKSKKEVIAAWNKNNDFIINDFFSPWDTKPVNKEDLNNIKLIEDFKNTNYTCVKIRFNQLRKVIIIKL